MVVASPGVLNNGSSAGVKPYCRVQCLAWTRPHHPWVRSGRHLLQRGFAVFSHDPGLPLCSPRDEANPYHAETRRRAAESRKEFEATLGTVSRVGVAPSSTVLSASLG